MFNISPKKVLTLKSAFEIVATHTATKSYVKMRTKTLLLTAAALAAGFVSSFAQSSNVYSVNVVGYYNTPIASHALAFVANQLTNSGNNASLILTNGMISDAAGLNNTLLQQWNGAGFNTYQYFSGVDADTYFGVGPGSPNGWYDAIGNLQAVTMDQGRASFLFNAAPVPLTNTIIGEVVQTTNTIAITTGLNVYSLVPPISTNIDNVLFSFPGTSDVNGVNNDSLLRFNGAGYNSAQYFTGADADTYFGIGPGSPSGFYDAVGNYVSLTAAFIPRVGEGFFLNHFGAPKSWIYKFTVQ